MPVDVNGMPTFFYCMSCRTVYLSEIDDEGGVIAPQCTNHTCARYGMACDPVPNG